LSAWSKGASLPEIVLPKDDLDEEPVNDNYASYGDFALVGHGERTNLRCGRFSTFKGCVRTELHDRITLDGAHHKGKVYSHVVFYSCDKPSCPVCYKKGWAVREAGKIEDRLAEASKRFGQVEHIIVSVPASDYGFTHQSLRQKVDKILKKRGVIGGVKIFHGFRYNKRKSWYWSVHFHVLGYILGGYSRCRNCKCKWNCLKGCGGFDDRSYQAFLKDGYYVKVLGKRKTVGGTAWYQLNHASYNVHKKRFHVAVWFGVASYRKLKLTKEKRKSLCPICKHELVKLRYFGDRRSIWARYGSDRESCEERDSYEDLEEDGRVVWMEKETESYKYSVD